MKKNKYSTPKYEAPPMPKTLPAKKKDNINREDVENIINELFTKPFILGDSYIETDTYKLIVKKKR